LVDVIIVVISMLSASSQQSAYKPSERR